MSKLILPDDPDFDKPVVMGDPYKNALTPKLAAQKRIEESNNSSSKYIASQVAALPDAWVKSAQASSTNNIMTNPMWFSPIHTPQSFQTPSKRRESYMWARYFYMNEPKVFSGVNFYAKFCMNGFELECKNQKILDFYKHHVVKKLRLNERFKEISAEYYLLGDVFIHADIKCEHCQGSTIDQVTQEICNHEGGMINRLFVMNPDWIEVQRSPLSDDPVLALIPDEELQIIAHKRQPKQIYDKIPQTLIKYILSRTPIPLSNRTTSHLRHMGTAYSNYGTSLVQCLFTTLAYKTKIMTANWVVAERMILPVRVVKIGSDQQPATSNDIADIQQQLAATANDPNLTIVTHHNFEYDFFGASGKILQVTQEMEHIDKEILDGLMLNQALLNGEMCLPLDHEVETPNGFVPLTEIKENDQIKVWNKETNEFQFETPKEFFKYDHASDIFEFYSNDKLLFKCTAAHKVVAYNAGEVKIYTALVLSQLILMFPQAVFSIRLLNPDSFTNIAAIKKVKFNQSVGCFETSTGYFVAKYNDSIFITGNSGYQSAQVGVETLIRRLESWRHTLAEWAEERIFKAVAEMQGFIDDEESEKVGEQVFLYPRIKWNDLELKDKTQRHQILMQLHDKQAISTQTLLEELELNYDQEVKRMRYEQVQMGPAGAMMGMGGGGGGMPGMGVGGGPSMGGGPGGPGGPGGLGGMDMGLGSGMGGPGGMAGGGAPAGGAGAAGPTAEMGGKILKKGKSKASQDENRIPMMPIKLTKIEQKMAGMLESVASNIGMNLNSIRMQFPVQNPKGGKPFTMDFAIPNLKLDFESDGEFHTMPQNMQDDKERDYLLAQRGWTVLRFDDKTIENSPQNVESTLYSYIAKAVEKSRQKVASNQEITGEVVYIINEDGKFTNIGENFERYYKHIKQYFV